MPEPGGEPNPLPEMRIGKFTLTFYEQPGQGGTKRFWSLSRDVPPGEKPLVIGGAMGELANARDLIDRAEQLLQRGRDIEPPQQEVSDGRRWLAVVWFEGLEPGGAAARVVRTYPEHERHEAEAFVEQRSEYALVPTVFNERIEKGDVVFVPAGMSKATDRHIEELKWQEENGKRFTWGVWYERESGPREGQIVTLGSGREPIRGDPEPRKILPFGRPVEPGEPDKPVCVVVERDEKVFGRGRIVAIHHDQSKAVEHAKELEQSYPLKERVLGPEWNTMTFKP
jgi:hypothetical protein